MNTKDVFKNIDKLEEEINEAQETINKLQINCSKIMDLCSHEIVFKYKDNFPRKAVFDGTYYCPACRKTIRCTDEKQIEESSFSKSRIIPLTNLSLFGSKIVNDAIKNEVESNMDYYYDFIIPTEELSSKMEEVLKNNEIKYERPEFTLKKRK